jgi:hypothetical protein
MYDPTVGEFLEEDPTEAGGQDTNFYRYCGNSPANATDPAGTRETDDRWITATKNLVDVTKNVETYINSWISCIWANDQALFYSPNPGQTAAQTAFLICRNMYQVLGEDAPNSGVWGTNMGPIAKIGKWLDTNLKVAKYEIVKLKFCQSRYHKNETTAAGQAISPFPWLFSETTADHGIAPVIRIGGLPGTTAGTLVGTDKFEHFFQQAFWLFNMVYGPARVALLKIDPKMPDFSQVSVRRAFCEWMEGIPDTYDPLIDKYRVQLAEVGAYFHVPLGKGGYGSASTGVASWADIQANLDGYLFYESLFLAFMKAPAGTAPVFSLSNYSISKWNEQNNKNWFVPSLKIDDKYDYALAPPPPSAKLVKPQPPWWAKGFLRERL